MERVDNDGAARIGAVGIGTGAPSTPQLADVLEQAADKSWILEGGFGLGGLLGLGISAGSTYPGQVIIKGLSVPRILPV